MLSKKDIKVGAFYKIVGTNGGCGDSKCKHCPCFKLGIRIDDLNRNDGNNRTVHGYAPFSNTEILDHCTFNPADLQLMTWQEVMKHKKINLNGGD